jgi:hypothetical protein
LFEKLLPALSLEGEALSGKDFLREAAEGDVRGLGDADN